MEKEDVALLRSLLVWSLVCVHSGLALPPPPRRYPRDEPL